MKRLLALLVFLILPSLADAATYYVDCNANGDAGAGTGTGAAVAWKTISKVNASSFSAGDSVLFNKGCTWRETLTVPSSGSAGNPITFGAYGTGAAPIIDGSDTPVTWTPVSGTSSVGDTGTSTDWINADYIYYNRVTTSAAGTLDNYNLYYGAGPPAHVRCALYTDVANSPTALVANSETAVVVPTTSGWTQVAPGGVVNLSASTTYWIAFQQDQQKQTSPRKTGSGNYRGYEARAYGAFPATSTTPTVENYDGGSFYINVTSTVPNVYNATLTGTAANQVFLDGVLQTKGASVAALTQHQWFASGATLSFYESAGDPSAQGYIIRASTRNYGAYTNGKLSLTFQDLSFLYQNLYGVNLGEDGGHNGDNLIVQRCTASYAYRNGIFSWVATSVNGPAPAVSILDNEVSYNGIGEGASGSYPVGIEIAGSDATLGTVVWRNNIHHNYWGAESDQGSANTSWRHNSIHDNSVLGMNIDNSDGNDFSYNLVYNNGANWGLRIWDAAGGTVSNTTVYNNVFYGNGIGIIVENEQTNLKIKNNLLTENTASASASEITMQSGKTYTGLAVDYNLYYRATGSTYLKWGATGYNLADWKTNSAGDAHAVNASPLLTSATDFHLQAGSPAINAGVSVGLTQDFLGRPVGNPPEIGAYEYGLGGWGMWYFPPASTSTMTRYFP